MIRIGGKHLVIKIVKQAGHPPKFHILSPLRGIRPERGFDRQRVFAQAVGFRVFMQQCKRVLSLHGNPPGVMREFDAGILGAARYAV